MRRRRAARGADRGKKLVRDRPLAVRLFADQDRHAPGRAQQRRRGEDRARRRFARLPGDRDMGADAGGRGLRNQQNRRARLEQRRLDRGLAVAGFVVRRAADDDEIGLVALRGDDGRLRADDLAPCRRGARPSRGAPASRTPRATPPSALAPPPRSAPCGPASSPPRSAGRRDRWRGERGGRRSKRPANAPRRGPPRPGPRGKFRDD